MGSAQGSGATAPRLPSGVARPHLQRSQGPRAGPLVLRGGGPRPPKPPKGGVSGGSRSWQDGGQALAPSAGPPRAAPWCGPTHRWASRGLPGP